jgi:hypothetical protein
MTLAPLGLEAIQDQVVEHVAQAFDSEPEMLR